MRIFLIILLLLLMPVVSAGAETTTAPAKPLLITPNSPVKKIPTAPPPDTSMNGITRAAANAGVHTCLQRIEQISSFITNNTQSSFVMFLPPADADQQFTSASIEVRMPGIEAVYASMTAAPSGNNCDAVYEAIAFWEKSCTVVAREDFSEAEPAGVVQQKITVLALGPTIRVFLMPAGTQGCVSIKKEVVYSP